MKPDRMLVVDDQPAAHARYRTALAEIGAAEIDFVCDAPSLTERLKSEEKSCDLLIVAMRPPVNGLALLTAARTADSQIPVIVVDSRPTLATATASFRAGADDYLDDALLVAELAPAVRRLQARRRLGDEHQLLRRQLERPYGYDEIIGASHGMQRVFQIIEQIAESDVDVLVTGPTGTGKELVARAIHRRSHRTEKPFVPVDCGAIPENLLESEFFGHERGSFTGADSRRIGLLEYADGGTFFLDELGELPLVLQAKLLRTLQERKVRRVGGREEIDVDVRIVAATARDLDEMVRQGNFRQDFYYRVNVVRIDLPPLCERGDDIGLLAEYFANRASREMQRPMVGISPEAFQVLRQYHWPGNVRELQNVIRRGTALSRTSMLSLEDLPDELIVSAGRRGDPAVRGYFQARDEYMARFERDYLANLLARHFGDVKTAAQEAKLPRGTLYRLMKSQGLEGGMFRPRPPIIEPR
jgi:DNA-binding NtrC family response regulator